MVQATSGARGACGSPQPTSPDDRLTLTKAASKCTEYSERLVSDQQ